jgi:hypothetical protein
LTSRRNPEEACGGDDLKGLIVRPDDGVGVAGRDPGHFVCGLFVAWAVSVIGTACHPCRQDRAACLAIREARAVGACGRPDWAIAMFAGLSAVGTVVGVLMILAVVGGIPEPVQDCSENVPERRRAGLDWTEPVHQATCCSRVTL